MNAQHYRYLLFPFSVLYGMVIYVRNWLFDNGIIKSIEFDFPIISVGNLTFGGTGKTPLIEYLIRLLSQQFRIATLSRGYKRQSHGFKMAQNPPDAKVIGDEPALLKRKYPHVFVSVSESRTMAVPQILSLSPQTDVILLDDAFQHRSIQPGMSIILTKYSDLFTHDHILPMGSLREFRSAYKRADFIVVTKCPKEMKPEEKKRIIDEIKPKAGQVVFFSYIDYFAAYLITDNKNRIAPHKDLDVFLFTGIASSDDLKQFLEQHVKNLYSMSYPDHHPYDRVDIENVTEAFQNIESANKIMLTTEKDAVRLYEHKEWILSKKLPIYVLPIRMDFFQEDKKLFDSEIINYLSRLKEHKAI